MIAPLTISAIQVISEACSPGLRDTLLGIYRQFSLIIPWFRARQARAYFYALPLKLC